MTSFVESGRGDVGVVNWWFEEGGGLGEGGG